MLPSPYCNNSNRSSSRSAFDLVANVLAFIQRVGLEHAGFLTLTFPDDVTDLGEAQRRFNSLRTRILRQRHPDHIAVLGRFKSGRIHFHLLIATVEDIRTGIDVDSLARGNYATASDALRNHWRFWSDVAPRYGFGRCQLLPVRSPERTASYFRNHLRDRSPSDRCARIVRYGGNARTSNTRFSWVGGNARQWRRGVAEVARRMGMQTLDDLRRHWGPRWAWAWRDEIFALGLNDADHQPFTDNRKSQRGVAARRTKAAAAQV